MAPDDRNDTHTHAYTTSQHQLIIALFLHNARSYGHLTTAQIKSGSTKTDTDTETETDGDRDKERE